MASSQNGGAMIGRPVARSVGVSSVETQEAQVKHGRSFRDHDNIYG